MIPITIPVDLAKEREFLLVPRKQFEALLRTTKSALGEIILTPSQKRVLATARKNRKDGTMLSIYELKRALGSQG